MMLKVAAVVLSGFTLLEACSGPHIQMEQVNNYNDSIPVVIPGIATIQTRIDDNEHMRLILGSSSLYKASEEQLQQYAVNAGAIALRVLGKDITTGTLIITQQQVNHTENPSDGRLIDMKIDSLKALSAP